jgi:hypothetical protein
MSEQEKKTLCCSDCSREVECCELCGEGCESPVCLRCMDLTLGRMVAHPHAHGG